MREAKTLTADEIAAFCGRRSVFTAEEANRMFATLEQQQAQIERMMEILRRVRNRFELNGEPSYSDLFKDIRKAIAATEPKP